MESDQSLFSDDARLSLAVREEPDVRGLQMCSPTLTVVAFSF